MEKKFWIGLIVIFILLFLISHGMRLQNRPNADFLGRPLHRPEGVALEADGFVKGDIQEQFVGMNPNYCQTKENEFIAITDPNDSRCLRNQKKQTESSVGITDRILNYLPCITDKNEWGLYHGRKCYPYHDFHNGKGKDKNGKMEFDESEWSGLSEEERERRRRERREMQMDEMEKRRREREKRRKNRVRCEKIDVPNAGPCIEMFENENWIVPDEFWKPDLDCSMGNLENLSLDEKCQCYTQNTNYGFYKNQLIGTTGQTRMLCRKYYKSTQNESTQEGTYQPEAYNIYIPDMTLGRKNMTGCTRMSEDLNEKCKELNGNERYGVAKILRGEDGNCYQQGTYNTPNKEMGNGICTDNYYDTRIKLMPNQKWNASTMSNEVINPNLFTKCITLGTNMQQKFQVECDKMKIEGYPLRPYAMDSYDCPVGEGRAKCKYQHS
jgi:hypothetical protein